MIRNWAINCITLWESRLYLLPWKAEYWSDLTQNLMQSIPHPNDAPDEVWLWLASWFQRYSCLKVRTPARVPYYKLTLSLRLWWAKNTFFDLAKVTWNAAQYPLHHVTYARVKFEVATSNGLGGDAFTRKYIIWPWDQGHMNCSPVSSNKCDLAPAKFEVAMSNGLGDHIIWPWPLGNFIQPNRIYFRGQCRFAFKWSHWANLLP